jgi:hypothetical protein
VRSSSNSDLGAVDVCFNLNAGADSHVFWCVTGGRFGVLIMRSLRT